MREVILTDIFGNEIGMHEIVDAHSGNGKLHRAFSVYIFRNNNNEILIQKRSTKKMLFAGMLANTCCSHPLLNEDILEAGQRRLNEECGFSCPLSIFGSFVYKANDPIGKGIEYEHVTLLVGTFDNPLLNPNPNEIELLKWENTKNILKDMKKNPHKYAKWFHIGLNKIVKKNNI